MKKTINSLSDQIKLYPKGDYKNDLIGIAAIAVEKNYNQDLQNCAVDFFIKLHPYQSKQLNQILSQDVGAKLSIKMALAICMPKTAPQLNNG